MSWIITTVSIYLVDVVIKTRYVIKRLLWEIKIKKNRRDRKRNTDRHCGVEKKIQLDEGIFFNITHCVRNEENNGDRFAPEKKKKPIKSILLLETKKKNL